MGALRAMTAQELLEYSHEPYRTELIAGRLVEMEPAGGVHGAVAARLASVLCEHVRPRGLGKVLGAETGYILELDPDTVRAPDASFLSNERIDAIGGIPDGYIPGPPDLAFEVTSPGDRRGEVESKTRSWLQAGTKAVVVVDPRRETATIHRPDGSTSDHGRGDVLELGDVLPGFAPALADILD
jgi:Uma2 family endonuclease